MRPKPVQSFYIPHSALNQPRNAKKPFKEIYSVTPKELPNKTFIIPAQTAKRSNNKTFQGDITSEKQLMNKSYSGKEKVGRVPGFFKKK